MGVTGLLLANPLLKKINKKGRGVDLGVTIKVKREPG